MRKKFLTCYDYQTGGVWQYIYADTEQQILKKYPALTIIDKNPDWLIKGNKRKLREYDIDDEPDSVMKGFQNV